MRMVPIQDFNDTDWYNAYQIVYHVETNEIMGTDPEIYTHPPTIVGFYEVATQKVEQEKIQGWLFYDSEDVPTGYVVLDKTKGEWELGIAIWDPEKRGTGIGVRATLHALKWAFEEKKLKWVTAFTQGTDLKVPQMIKRMGFEKLYHFWVMTPQIWDERWAGRIK